MVRILWILGIALSLGVVAIALKVIVALSIYSNVTISRWPAVFDFAIIAVVALIAALSCWNMTDVWRGKRL